MSFDDLAGKIVTFHRGEGSKLLIGKVLEWEMKPHDKGPDCSLMVEGRSGKRLKLASFIEYGCYVHPSWDAAREYVALSPADRVAHRRTPEKKPVVKSKAPATIPTTAVPAVSTDITDRLDRIEKMLTLVCVDRLNKSPDEVHALIAGMHIQKVDPKHIV